MGDDLHFLGIVAAIVSGERPGLVEPVGIAALLLGILFRNPHTTAVS